jgi:DNA damage-inducible protein 1
MQLTVVLPHDLVASVEVRGARLAARPITAPAPRAPPRSELTRPPHPPSQVADDATAAAVLAAVEAQTGAPAAAHALTFNGAPLRPGAPLAGQGVAGGDLVVAVPLGPPPPPAGAAASAAADPAAARMLAEARRPEVYARLPPAVRALVDGGDAAAVAALARQMAAQGGGGGGGRAIDPEEERLHAEAEADPFNVEIQKKLEALVQRKNALENYEGAMESFPEAFGDVVML